MTNISMNFNDGDVLAFKGTTSWYGVILKAEDFEKVAGEVLSNEMMQVFQKYLRSKYLDINVGIDESDSTREPVWKWVREGVDCDLLRLGASQWQKGKLKISVSLEFVPDSSEEAEILNQESFANPLDEFRTETTN